MKIILLLSLTALSFSTFAQRGQNVYFLKNDGREVKIRDSADFIRIIREPDEGKPFYELVEYYPNNELKRTGETSKISPLKLEGRVLSYAKNGQVVSDLTYSKGLIQGEAKMFYNNGKLKEIRKYESDPTEPLKRIFKILQIADSLGNTFLDGNGNGFVNQSLANGDYRKGEYVNGKKNGFWEEYNSKSKIKNEDLYDHGEFISGKFTTDDEETGTYTIKEKLPQFKGGVKRFYVFLSNNLKYPSDSKKNKEQGQVVLKFIVEKDGTLSDIKVLRGISSSLDDEAIRVLQLSPKWEPGIQNGRAARTSFTVPITFRLQ